MFYNRLLSLNEVGGAPDRFGASVEEFHDFNLRRLARCPHAMNARLPIYQARRGCARANQRALRIARRMGKEFTNMEQNQPGEKDQDQGRGSAGPQ